LGKKGNKIIIDVLSEYINNNYMVTR